MRLNEKALLLYHTSYVISSDKFGRGRLVKSGVCGPAILLAPVGRFSSADASWTQKLPLGRSDREAQGGNWAHTEWNGEGDDEQENQSESIRRFPEISSGSAGV